MNQFFHPRAATPPAVGVALQSNVALTTVLLFVVSFLPTTVFYLFGTPSHATGVVIACLIAALIYALTPTQSVNSFTFDRWLLLVVLIVLLMAAHLLIASLFNELTLGRAVYSLMAFATLLTGAFFVFATLSKVTDASLETAAALARVAFVGVGLLGIVGIQPLGASELISTEKSVFPFAEPSHFAIAFTPFLLHGCLLNRGLKQVSWILIGFALAYLLRNLSLVLGTTLAALICLPFKRLVVIGVLLGLTLEVLDLEYFTSRLDFTFQSQSISALVYRQGWELAADALNRTAGWGIGFQQLGFAPFQSPSADLLHRILYSDSNILDGGFLAAKLVAEFGLLGLLVLALYIYLAARLAWRLRKSVARGSPLPPKFLFSAAVICGFSVELFVRAVGYFSGSAILAVAAILMLANIGNQYRVGAARSQTTS